MDESGTTREVRVTVEEAARLLGIEKASVKKRIQRDKLKPERDDSGVLYVWLDVSETVQDPSGTGTETVRDELVDALRDQVADLRARLDREQDANRENRRIIAAFTSRIPELEAPRDRPEGPETVEEAPEVATPRSDSPGPQEATEAPERRGWWRRVFGGG